MRKIVINCLILLSVLTTQGCKEFPPPKTELCIGTSEGDLACNDPRIDDESYFRPLNRGDFCTNVDDFKSIESYCIDLRKELIKCRQSK